MRILIRCACIAAFLALLASCGGGDDGGSTPTAPTGSGTSTATITITSSGGLSPGAVTVTRGDRITVVNNDDVAHTMSSDPHPVHTLCPALNFGTLNPGQSRDSGTLPTARVCGMHDHDDPDNGALHGVVTIQ